MLTLARRPTEPLGWGDAHRPESRSRQEGAAERVAVSRPAVVLYLEPVRVGGSGERFSYVRTVLFGVNSYSSEMWASNSQTHKNLFPSKRIILKLPGRTERVSVTPRGSRLYIPVSG